MLCWGDVTKVANIMAVVSRQQELIPIVGAMMPSRIKNDQPDSHQILMSTYKSEIMQFKTHYSNVYSDTLLW